MRSRDSGMLVQRDATVVRLMWTLGDLIPVTREIATPSTGKSRPVSKSAVEVNSRYLVLKLINLFQFGPSFAFIQFQ